jgi:hypothetical protein
MLGATLDRLSLSDSPNMRTTTLLVNQYMASGAGGGGGRACAIVPAPTSGVRQRRRLAFSGMHGKLCPDPASLHRAGPAGAPQPTLLSCRAAPRQSTSSRPASQTDVPASYGRDTPHCMHV